VVFCRPGGQAPGPVAMNLCLVLTRRLCPVGCPLRCVRPGVLVSPFSGTVGGRGGPGWAARRRGREFYLICGTGGALVRPCGGAPGCAGSFGAGAQQGVGVGHRCFVGWGVGCARGGWGPWAVVGGGRSILLFVCGFRSPGVAALCFLIGVEAPRVVSGCGGAWASVAVSPVALRWCPTLVLHSHPPPPPPFACLCWRWGCRGLGGGRVWTLGAERVLVCLREVCVVRGLPAFLV